MLRSSGGVERPWRSHDGLAEELEHRLPADKRSSSDTRLRFSKVLKPRAAPKHSKPLCSHVPLTEQTIPAEKRSRKPKSKIVSRTQIG